MHPEKVWIVVAIVVLVLVGSNLVMFSIVRGTKNIHLNIFKDATKTWKKEEDGLKELSDRVKDLKKDN
jgi:hypothetical protein